MSYPRRTESLKECVLFCWLQFVSLSLNIVHCNIPPFTIKHDKIWEYCQSEEAQMRVKLFRTHVQLIIHWLRQQNHIYSCMKYEYDHKNNKNGTMTYYWWHFAKVGVCIPIHDYIIKRIFMFLFNAPQSSQFNTENGKWTLQDWRFSQYHCWKCFRSSQMWCCMSRQAVPDVS